MDIESLIIDLETADRAELADRWQRCFRSTPPKGVSQRFLIAAIVHSHQLKAHGQSASRLQLRLARAVGKANKASLKPVSNAPAPGTRLIREWNGATYTVDVTDDRFVLDGVPYRSLSAVARAITGARWSGPRFFGLAQGS